MTTAHLFNAQAKAETLITYSMDASNPGRRMLELQGWVPHTGLGKCGHGMLAPLATRFKSDRRGLGNAPLSAKRRTHTTADIEAVKAKVREQRRTEPPPPPLTAAQRTRQLARDRERDALLQELLHTDTFEALHPHVGVTPLMRRHAASLLRGLGPLPPPRPSRLPTAPGSMTRAAPPGPSDPLPLFQQLRAAVDRGERHQTASLLKRLRPHLRLAKNTRRVPKPGAAPEAPPDALAGIPQAALTALMNALLRQCSSKEAVLGLFNDLTKDGLLPDATTYTIVMKGLLGAPTKWDDIRTVLGVRQRMVDAGVEDTAETVGVLLALAALQTPVRAEKYRELWDLTRAKGIVLDTGDFVYFFDTPPLRRHEAFVEEVAAAMRRRTDIPAERVDRYLSKWHELRQKYEEADLEYGGEATDDYGYPPPPPGPSTGRTL